MSTNPRRMANRRLVSWFRRTRSITLHLIPISQMDAEGNWHDVENQISEKITWTPRTR